jgi:hypothetical protein
MIVDTNVANIICNGHRLSPFLFVSPRIRGYIWLHDYIIKNGEIEIEYPDLLVKNFNKKNKQTKDKYRQTIVIFKNILLRNEKIDNLPSEIIETILYNVPNSLFEDDSQSSLIKIINFIRNNSLQDFLTIDEQDKAFTSRYRSMSSFYVKHILRIIENYLSKI